MLFLLQNKYALLPWHLSVVGLLTCFTLWDYLCFWDYIMLAEHKSHLH